MVHHIHALFRLLHRARTRSFLRYACMVSRPQRSLQQQAEYIQGGVWDCSAPRFLAKRFQLHALSSRKKGGVVRAPKELLHKLQFFCGAAPQWSLWSRVCEAVPNTPIVLYYKTNNFVACRRRIYGRPGMHVRPPVYSLCGRSDGIVVVREYVPAFSCMIVRARAMMSRLRA